jgi:hypothetical protein
MPQVANGQAHRATGSDAVPAAPKLRLYAAVFLLFAPIGLLVGLVQQSPWGWGGGLAAAIFAGINAAMWQNAITRRRWWLLAIVALLPFAAQWVYFTPLGGLGIYAWGAGMSDGWRRITLALLSVASLSLGFTLLVWYIRAAEHGAARARAELDVARLMHETIVPAITHDAGWATVHAVSIASSEMGGDLIDLVPRADGGMDLLLADVSGHGVGAGLVMSMLKGAARVRLLAPGTVGEIASDLNRVLHALVPGHVFVTAALLRCHADGRLEYTLAGHLPIFLRRADGSVERLENECLPMGVSPDEMFGARTALMRSGDAAVVFTDGLMEVMGRDGSQLGLDPLAQVIATTPTASAESLGHALVEAARRHGPQNDDQSVLVIQWA